MTTDQEFLHWVADRFVHVYGESEHVDFVQKLRAIADSLPDRNTSWSAPDLGARARRTQLDEHGNPYR